MIRMLRGIEMRLVHNRHIAARNYINRFQPATALLVIGYEVGKKITAIGNKLIARRYYNRIFLDMRQKNSSLFRIMMKT